MMNIVAGAYVVWPLFSIHILANCPYLIGTVPILTQEKVGKRNNFTAFLTLFLQKSVCSNV